MAVILKHQSIEVFASVIEEQQLFESIGNRVGRGVISAYTSGAHQIPEGADLETELQTEQEGRLALLATYRGIIRQTLQEGGQIDPVDAQRYVERICDPVAEQTGAAEEISLLRAWVLEPKQFTGNSEPAKDKRWRIATMFHTLDVFAANGRQQAVLSMQSDSDLGRGAASLPGVYEHFRVSWQPLNRPSIPAH